MSPVALAGALHQHFNRPTAPTPNGALVFARTDADARDLYRRLVGTGRRAELDTAHRRIEVRR